MDAEHNQEEESKILGEDDTEEVDEVEEGGKQSALERYCGVGRVWIFLALGVLTLVLSAVLAGIHMNVRVITSSLDQVEIMPSFLPAAMGGVAGVLVLLLFWRRYKVLVYGAVTLCATTAVLCVVASVLTGTHVLRPLLSVSGCVYRRPDRACRCVTQFRRVGMGLEEVPRGDDVFLTMEGTLGCDDVHTVLPGLMYAMVGVYGVIALVCLLAGVISFLVYRTELRRKYLQNLAYDDQFRSPSGQQDIHAEYHAMVPLQPSSPTNAPMLVNTYINPGSTANDEDSSTNNDGNTTPSDLIYSPADVPMGYTEACRMRRCQSFNQPRRGSLREGSPGSSASSQTASLSGRDRNVGQTAEGPSKLKAHRKKGRRAVTLHGLDREQLLLILSLQMRYLQESDQSARREDNTNKNAGNSKHGGAVSCEPSVDSPLLFAQQQRRALTPTPRQERLSSNRSADDDLDYRPAKLVRSHTPQPYHFRATQEYRPPPDDDEQPTLITFDLRNIKAGPVVYGHASSAQSSLSGCGPDSSCSSHNSSLTSSSATPSQSKLTPGLSHLLTHLSPESTHLSMVKNANIDDAGHPSSQSGHPSSQSGHHTSQPGHPTSQPGHHTSQTGHPSTQPGHPSSQLGHHTSQMSTSSLSDSDISPSDTRKLISSEENMRSGQEPAKTKSRQFPRNEEVRKKESDHPVGVVLHRTDSSSSRMCTGTDRWQALMENGPRQAQTLWENVQRKAQSDPQAPDYTLDSLLLTRHQFEAAAPDVGCCEPPYAINAQLNHGSCAAVRSPQSDSFPQVTRTGQLDNLNVIFNNLPEARVVPTYLPLSSNPSHDLHHKTLTTASRSECYPPLQNAFIPIDSSFTDNSEDTDCSPQQSDFGPTNQAPLSKATVPSRCDVQQAGKLDQFSSSARPTSGAQPSLDRLQSRPKNSFDMEVASETHLNDPLSNSSQTLGQWVETELCTMSVREMGGSLRGGKRTCALNRHLKDDKRRAIDRHLEDDRRRALDRHLEDDRRCALDRPVEDDKRHVFDRPLDDRCFLDRHLEDDRRHVSDRHIEDDWRRVSNRSLEDRKRVLDRHLEDDRRRVLDRHQEDNQRHVLDRSLEDDILYETANADVYSQARRQQHTSTRSTSDRSLQQVYHNPYAVQASSGLSSTNRHVYNSSAPRPQHSAFYTLGHGPKYNSFHHSQEGACDTDLDSLPAPQPKGQYVRGQSLPPPALYHSLESVARPVPSRSGLTTSCDPQGTLYTSSELSVTPSHGGHLDPRPGSHSWNPSPSRYPSYQANPSIDHRYYTQQHNLPWNPQASRGLSREQLYEDNQAHNSSHRQPRVNMRRCQSVDEGNRSSRPHLYANSSRAGQQDRAGSFYQNNSALRAEMKNGAAVNVRRPVFQSYQTPGCRSGPRLVHPPLLSKKVLTNDIAGCMGVVNPRDSGEFVETVI